MTRVAVILCLLVFAPRALARETKSDAAFLEDLSHRAFLYFWEQTDPHTGLTLDRANVDGSSLAEKNRRIASIAATGFALTAYAIAADRHWIPEDQLRERTRTTLRFFAKTAPREHGFFYHWMDPATGERRWQSEVSSIDTALLLGGVLTVRRRFAADPEIASLADSIYRSVDFAWLLRADGTLGHGWNPETGMLRSGWNKFSEHMLLYVLAIGSPTHPIPASSTPATL